MHFTSLVLGACAAAVAMAQSDVLTFTHVPNPITDGKAVAISYNTNDTEAPVTILLRQGPSNDLKTVATLTTSASGGQYIWTPPKSLPNGDDYALQIKQGDQINYYGPFTVQGSSGGPASYGGVSSSSSSSSSSSRSSGSASMSSYPTMSASHNMTAMPTVSGHSTGIVSYSRNATMSSATLSRTSNTATATTGGSGSQSSGAGFQSSGTPRATNAAVAAYQAGSSVALLFGAVGAIMFA